MKNVLRMRPGEKLGISDGNNHHYICQVEKYEDAQAVLTSSGGGECRYGIAV